MAEGDCLKVEDTGKEFCYSRKSPCPCSKAQKYTAHNQGLVESWGKYLQMRKRSKTNTLESYRRAVEHHHIVCVSAIQKLIPDQKFFSYARCTTWCINDKANLIGLPMWALHLMHYCNLLRARPQVRSAQAGPQKLAPVEPPPFSNRPMHDQDHDLYIKEVDDELGDIIDDLAAVEACQDPQQTLAAELDGVVETYSVQLYTNALAFGGTHTAWNLGMNDPNGRWYVAFSMSRSPRPRTHPMSPGDFGDKLDYLHKAFWIEGKPIMLG